MKRISLILITFLICIFNIGCEDKKHKFPTAYREYLEEVKKHSPPIKEKKIYSPGEKEYEKAQEYLFKGKYKKTIEIYQQIMKKYPNEKRKEYLKDKHLYLQIAACYENLYQFSKAYQIYSNLIKKYTDKDEIYVTVKYGLDFIDKYKLIELEEKRKNKEIPDWEFFLKLVNVFMDEGRDREGILPLIEKAFKLNPNHPEILLRLGQVYDRKGNSLCHHGETDLGGTYKADAAVIFYTIIREYPTSGFADDAQYYYAEQSCDSCFVMDNDYQQAIREYEKLINQYPESEFCPKARLGIARCYGRLNDCHQAIEECKKVIERYPDTKEAITAQYDIGINYLQLKNYKKAIEAFQKTIDNFPNSEEAGLSLLHMAEIYEKLKDYNKAIELYEEYIHNYAKKEIDKEIYQEEIRRLKKLKKEL